MTLVRSDHRIHRLIGLQQWLFLLGFGTSVLFYRILGIQERRLEGIVGRVANEKKPSLARVRYSAFWEFSCNSVTNCGLSQRI